MVCLLEKGLFNKCWIRFSRRQSDVNELSEYKPFIGRAEYGFQIYGCGRILMFTEEFLSKSEKKCKSTVMEERSRL